MHPSNNPFGQLLLEEMTRDVAFARTNLLERMERARLPEHLFRKYFLDYFVGRIEATAENMIVANWIGIAGSPTSEVEVTDPSGQVLFIVPAIFTTSSLNPNRNDHQSVSFKRLIEEVQQQEVVLPPMAANTLIRGLAAKAQDVLGSGGVNQIDADRWLAIYRYYNIQPQTATVAGRSTQLDADDDIVGYS